MAKYSTEFKTKVVKEYLKGNISLKKLAEKYSISHHEIVRRWVSSYQRQGYEGLKVKRENTQYTLEFKLNVVNLYLTGEMSYQSLANELKISNPAIITRWVNDFRKQGIEGLKPKKRGRSSSINIRFQIFIYTNSAEKIKSDKEKSTEKIDGVIAMVSNKV